MKGYTLLLALAACANAQYFYPQPSPAFDLPAPETVPPPTVRPVTVPQVDYLPPVTTAPVILPVVAETTRPTLPPTTRPTPPPTTRPTPPPTTRPTPPPTTRPPPPLVIQPVVAPEQVYYQPPVATNPPTLPPTTRPPPPPTTRPPPPPTTRPTLPPTTRPPVTVPVVAAPAVPAPGYEYLPPEVPFLGAQSGEQSQVVAVPTTTTRPVPPTAPVTAEEHHDHHHDHHLFWDFRESIPGEPGQDYPILDTIPTTSFTCKGKVGGYYADVEAGCQVYHVCTVFTVDLVTQTSFLCPNGTIFNQEAFSCQWWPDVNCRESDKHYALNENIGKVPEKPAVSAVAPGPVRPVIQPVVAEPPRPSIQAALPVVPVPQVPASSNQQQVILIPLPTTAAPQKPVNLPAATVSQPTYEKPTQLYGAPPLAAASADQTIGLQLPVTSY